MAARPSIPVIEGVDDDRVATILGAIKTIVENITGRTPNRPLIKTLGGSATLGGVINKTNEIINRIQETDVPSIPVAPVATTTSSSGSSVSPASQADQEAGSSTAVYTSPGTQQFHPSAAKVWCSANISGSILSSYNMTSVTDVGTGAITFTIATDFSSGAWGYSISMNNTGQCQSVSLTAQAAGSASAESRDTSNTLADPSTSWSLVGFGDQ